MAEPFTVLIMAAGRGTRMRSDTPKVLHPVCGRPMVEWVIEAANEAGAERVVCVARPDDGVAEGLPEGVDLASQTEGEGTGSAVLAARDQLDPEKPVVILSGDHPLVSAELIEELLQAYRREAAAATLLTTDRLEPSGYGRIVRSPDGSVEQIVETKETAGLSASVLAIREINLGTYAFDAGALLTVLDQVDLVDGERYLTAAIPELRSRGRRISTHLTRDTLSALGVNTRIDLMEAELLAQRRLIDRHALAGVTFVSPWTSSVDAGVEIGRDTTIAPGVTLKGQTKIGAGCQVGPQASLIDTEVGDGVTVLHSYLQEAEVHDSASVGPFAYLRPGAVIGEGARIGTFVEVKNSEIGAGAKVPHLSYLGDADVGEGANVAAGNITANYDGREKHRTKIGKRVKSGVHTSFVAPVSVGDDAYTGAGSVITDDVPEGALGISRPEQKNVEGYSERVEQKPPE